jgi:hypothetical protein
MQDALAADANYAPALFELYVYYYERDVNAAIENFAKYKTVTDVTPEMGYEERSIDYAARKFQSAIDKSKAAISTEGDKADPRNYKLIGYSYAELKDTANAKTFMDQYFAKQKEEGFVPKDYSFYAQLLARTKGSEAQAFTQFEKAIALDTVRASKLKLMDEAAKLGKAIGDCKQEAAWYKKIYKFDTAASNRDLYNWGFAEFSCDSYDTAYAVFTTYSQKYPDEIYGWLWRSKAAQVIDSTWEKGFAATETEQYANQASRIDSVKFKAQIVQSYKLLAQYHNNVKKDKDSAIVYLEKVKAINPADPDAQKFIDILKKAKQPATQKTGGGSSGGSKPNGSSSASNNKK